MYTILVMDDHSLVATRRERIMQRSKIVDTLRFLVPPTYEGLDMSQMVVCLEYLTPVGRKYETEILVKSTELYKDHLEYKLPFDTKLTNEPGELELQLTFAEAVMDVNGVISQPVRKTEPTTITITPIAAWADIIPDSALTALDQRLILLNAQMKGLSDLANSINNTRADNIYYDDEEETLQLTSNGVGIGDKISVKDMLDEGVPVVDLDGNGNSSGENTGSGCNCGCEDNVVEIGYIDVDMGIHGEEIDEDNVVEF